MLLEETKRPPPRNTLSRSINPARNVPPLPPSPIPRWGKRPRPHPPLQRPRTHPPSPPRKHACPTVVRPSQTPRVNAPSTRMKRAFMRCPHKESSAERFRVSNTTVKQKKSKKKNSKRLQRDREGEA